MVVLSELRLVRSRMRDCNVPREIPTLVAPIDTMIEDQTFVDVVLQPNSQASAFSDCIRC